MAEVQPRVLPIEEEDPSHVEGNRNTSTTLVLQSRSRDQSSSRLRYPILATIFALLVVPFTFPWSHERPVDQTNYAERTQRVLKSTPLIDGHNDLPWQLRIELQNRIYDGRLNLDQKLLGHTDLVRMKQGMIGGQFWSVYVDCDVNQHGFEDPSWIVRDTLEQIDVTRRFIKEHPQHLEFCDTTACARSAFKSGHIASMIGIEGGHQVGGNLATIRQMFALGSSTVGDGGPDGGLSPLGIKVVQEMNRLGMIVDLSHVSHRTMRDALSVARAPVVFSHSGAYGVEPHLRNVPDDVLRLVKKNRGIVMVVFVNRFLNMENPDQATIHDVVDHIMHIADVCGWGCIGIGSDFSGTAYVPKGLEDVSKYPELFQLIMRRGATDEQARMVAGENVLRVWADVENRAAEIQESGAKPVEEESEFRSWHTGIPNSPWMLPRARRGSLAKKP